MIVRETELEGVLLVKPDVYPDERGRFLEIWSEVTYSRYGMPRRFVQDNVSYSEHGVLRGLHFQNPSAQGKLITVFDGEIFDVAVNLRQGSSEFGRWVGQTLSAENAFQMYVPEGFAHGFVVTGKYALVGYKCTAGYNPDAEHSIRWDDPDIGIDWPVDDPVLSRKDAGAPLLADFPGEILFDHDSL